jgi:hypothetical protein
MHNRPIKKAPRAGRRHDMCTSKLSDCRGCRPGETGFDKVGYAEAVVSVESVKSVLSVRHLWPFGSPQCMKMIRRSPDERLRTAADCLSRLRSLGPDPMPIQHERNTFGDKPDTLILRRAWSGLRTRWRRVSAAIRNRLSGRGRPPCSVVSVEPVKPVEPVMSVLSVSGSHRFYRLNAHGP